MSKQIVIGLHGLARSGKDEAAKALSEYTRFAFADNVRDALYALNPQVCLAKDDRTGLCETLQYWVDRFSWDGVKVFPEVRGLLQRMGTESGRRIFGQDCWVDLLHQQIRDSGDPRIVITDVRFPNECSICTAVIRIRRPGVEPALGHVSESGLPDDLVHYTINNTGTVMYLHAQVRAVVNEVERSCSGS